MKKRNTQPEDIPQRALCVSACIVRGEVENALRANPSEDTKDSLKLKCSGIVKWLLAEKIFHYLLDNEKEMLNLRAGTWDEEAIVNFTWQSEALGMLLWGLGILDDHLPIDELFSSQELIIRIPFLLTTKSFCKRRLIRNKKEIEKKYFEAELWNWRVQVWMAEQKHIPPPVPWTWAKIVRLTLIMANRAGLMPEPLDDDFPCFGMPFKMLDSEKVEVISSASMERMRALGWMAGFLKNWSDNPLRNKPSDNPYGKDINELPYEPF